MGKYDCLRCGREMVYATTARFQLGEHSVIFGDLPNLIAGSLKLSIYRCPACNKIEFYAPDESELTMEDRLPQVVCPKCGTQHDFDYPKCPRCSHDYYAK